MPVAMRLSLPTKYQLEYESGKSNHVSFLCKLGGQIVLQEVTSSHLAPGNVTVIYGPFESRDNVSHVFGKQSVLGSER